MTFNKKVQIQDKEIAFLLLIFSFILRFGYALLIYYTQPLPLKNIYYDLAQEIINQGSLFYNISDPYFEVIGPLLPWLNAITMLIFGKNYLGLYFVTSLISALITFFTFKTARIFLDRLTSIVAGIWSFFYFYYYYFASTPGKDIWMAFFMIFLIYMLLKLFVKKEFTNKAYLFFIFIYVISFHLDERFFMFIPFLIFYIFYQESNAFKKLVIKKSVLFLVITIILMMPWTIRNYINHDKIILISTRTQTLTDKVFGYEADGFDGDSFMDLYGFYYLRDCQIDSVLSGTKKITDGGYTIPEKQRQAMMQGILPKPFTILDRYWLNTKILLRPFQIAKGEFQKTGYCYYEQSLRQRIVSFMFYGILFFFSFPGFYFLFRLNKHIFYFLLFTIIIYTLIHTLFVPWTTWRYRLPLDAIFIIVGCLGITHVFSKFFNRFKSA